MNKESSKYPKNWCEVYLTEIIANLESGKRPKGGVSEYLDGTPSLGGEHLDDNGGFKFKKIKYVPISFAARMSKGRVEHEDILVVKDGATTGKVSFVGESFPYKLAVINEHLFSIKLPTTLNRKWIFYQLWSQSGNEQILLDFRGAAQGGISSRFTELVQVSIPPLAEQHRIVAKIEELFSELDQGIANLKTGQAQLKVYRQALLKHAFEGKLTAHWREQNKGKLESATALQQRIQTERAARYQQQLADWQAKGQTGSKPKAPKTLPPLTNQELTELPELPEGWIYARFGSVIDDPTYGTSKKCDYEIEGTGVLRIPNVVSGRIDASDLKFAQFTDDELSTYKLNAGDILIIRSNGSVSIVGRCAIVSENDTNFLYAGYLIRLRPNKSLVDSGYLLNTFILHSTRKQIELKAKSTSGVNNINTGEIQSLIISLCGIQEQKVIVESLEARLSEVDQLEQAITTALQQSEVLRQSILKKAFSGQLVPQDANDEPATALLMSIKAEKENKVKLSKSTK